MIKHRAKSRRRGRPRGSRVPLERDRQRFAVATWWGLHEIGYGPYEAAYLTSTAVGDDPIRLEDVEGLLTLASTQIKRTASSLDEHINALVRKAKRVPATDWLVESSAAIRALVMYIAANDTARACIVLDVLVELGWGDVIQRLTERMGDALKSNVPPYEGKLRWQGRALLARLQQRRPKNPNNPRTLHRQ